MNWKVYILCFSAIFNLASTDDSCNSPSSKSPYRKLKREVFCDHDPTIIPVKNHDTAVQVNVTFYPRYLSMDDMENVLRVHVLADLMWQDEFIKWDPKNYEGITFMVLDGSSVWTPELQLYNDRYFAGSEFYFRHVYVYYTGLVYAAPHTELEAHCDLNVYNWPFDRHVCKTQIGSLTHNAKYVDFNLSGKKVDMILYFNSSSWRLENVDAKKVTKYNNDSNVTHKYVQLQQIFTVKRYSTTLMASVTIPTITCVALTLISLWMNPQNLMRPISVIVSIVGHVSFLQYLGTHLTSNANSGVLVIMLLRDSLVLTVLAFIIASVNLQLLSSKSPPPSWLSSIIIRISTTPVKFALLPDDNTNNLTDEDVTALVKPNSDKFKREWTTITCLIDRTIFYLFVLIYIILMIVYNF